MTTKASHDAYDILINLRKKMTLINEGTITPEAIDKLEDELGGIFTMAKTHHYDQGQKYGHLASAIPKAKYRLVIVDPAWTHTVPTDPGAYSADALTAGNVAATRKQYVAQHKVKQKSYNDYLSDEEAGKELILYAVGKDAIAPLKRQYIGFGDMTVLKMIEHLCLKTAIKMTTAKKYEYKTNGYNTLWDPTTSITSYFTLLDRFQVSLNDRGIATSEDKKNDGSGRTNVAVGDVHRRPNGCMGRQADGRNDVDGPPRLLHREVAGAQTVLRHHGETILFQRSSTPRTRSSSGRGGR